MTSLIRWEPRTGLFRSRLSRLMDEAFNDFLAPLAGGEETRLGTWTPAVDIRETDEALLFTAELPGMKKEDVEVTVEHNVLTLRGERKFERQEEKESYHRVERVYGQFTRSFGLPANVRTDGVNATFADGVLTVELPKAEDAKPRRVDIR